MDLTYSFAGGFVGFLVGLTGVGGGALMAPLLILVFGFSPAVAVGTDLWFASITKAVGGAVHHRIGSPNWKIVFALAAGSLPAALLTLVWIGAFHAGKLESDLLMKLLGGALLLTSGLIFAKSRIQLPLHRLRNRIRPSLPALRGPQLAMTVLGGAIVGCVVTLTSVGAGALVAVILSMLYPLRLGTKAIVGTDIIHAVPLTLLAALGHSWFGNVDVTLLVNLLLGSVPGIVLGSMAAGKINEGVVRYSLAAMLFLSSIKLLLY